MKEIKYRLYGKENKVMYEWDEILAFDSFRDTLEAASQDSKYYSPLLEYIGVKDKNNKEIYEGDILKDETGLGRVTWVQEHCAFLVFVTEPSGYHYLESDGQLIDTEIIGNIYENPELLG